MWLWCGVRIRFRVRDIEAYYPGDDATDWVGVNMYSVTYHNNSLQAPSRIRASLRSAVVDLRHAYAARKPFMICEFAATHYADCDRPPRVDFATRKIETLYAALPRLFPRVKAINYFDSNNIQFTDHANNNYSVTDDPVVLASYREYHPLAHIFSTVPCPTTPRPCPRSSPCRCAKANCSGAKWNCRASPVRRAISRPSCIG